MIFTLSKTSDTSPNAPMPRRKVISYLFLTIFGMVLVGDTRVSMKRYAEKYMKSQNKLREYIRNSTTEGKVNTHHHVVYVYHMGDQ